MSEAKRKILFLCTGNSCRSQMAEGLLRHLGGERFEPLSAGLNPRDRIHPLAIRVMAEIGIDISRQKPKSVKVYLGKASISVIITVCRQAEESCPRIWPGVTGTNRMYWPLEDPAETMGTEAEKLLVFREVREELKQKIHTFLDTKRLEV